MAIFNISSAATEPVVTKFNVEPSGIEGIKTHLNGPDHMINNAAMPVDCMNL